VLQLLLGNWCCCPLCSILLCFLWLHHTHTYFICDIPHSIFGSVFRPDNYRFLPSLPPPLPKKRGGRKQGHQ
jgi:hypothetical protein